MMTLWSGVSICSVRYPGELGESLVVSQHRGNNRSMLSPSVKVTTSMVKLCFWQLKCIAPLSKNHLMLATMPVQ